MNSIIHLYSGKRFNLLKPRPQDVDIESVAHGLSQIVRWTGQCSEPITVGQHSCLCCDMGPPEHKFSLLCHDMQESLVNDCSRPLKDLIPQYSAIEHRIEKMMCRKYGIPYPHPPIVKEIDIRMLLTEMRQFIKGSDWKLYPSQPFDIKIKVWSHKRAEREFLKRFHQLYKSKN